MTMKKNGYKCNLDVYTDYRSKTSLLNNVINTRNPKNLEDAFYIGDLGDIVCKYRDWKLTFPKIEPFYAVKCNDQLPVLKTLADLGCNFDCASKYEMERVLKLGVSPRRIIFANPVKQVSFIRYARQHNVDLMTFDNETELFKIQAQYPEARLILRILPPSNFKVQCELGMKFGCLVSKAQHLLYVAQELNLNVVGVSFHVGSGCEDASAFEAAIREAAGVYKMAANMGFDVSILDIGGGFPGQNTAPVPFVKIADVVKAALWENFTAHKMPQVIAEPGRYFVASAFTLAVNIIAKRVVSGETMRNNEAEVETGHPSFMYYINDGVYGSFNCILYDHATVNARVLNGGSEMLHTCSLWGPTCDGLDCVMKECLLPELHIGDWLYFEDMGAYTMCAASTFNGMPRSKCYFHVRADLWLVIVKCSGTTHHPSDACTCPTKKTDPYTSKGAQMASVEL